MNFLTILALLFAIVNLSFSSCIHGNLLGDKCGGIYLPKTSIYQENASITASLAANYNFYGRKYSELFVCENGFVSFERDICNISSNTFTPLIGGFMADLNIAIYPKSVVYYAIELTDDQDFGECYENVITIFDILSMSFGDRISGFSLTHISIASWRYAPLYDELGTTMIAVVTFQIVLATDSNSGDTYALLLYGDIFKHIRYDLNGIWIGFAGNDMQNFTHPLASHTMSLNKNSNTGICGAYAYRIDGDRILDPDVCYTLDHPANGQVEYGSDGFTATYTCNSGYELMFGNSTRECDKHGWSGTQPMCPAFLLPFGYMNAQECLTHNAEIERVTAGEYTFYGQPYNQIFICENGLLSFENNFCSADTEWRSNTPPIIAVLGGDIDKECHVSYGEITESTSNFIGLKLHVKRLLQKGFNDTILNFDPTHIFVATWFRVNDTQDNDSITVNFQIVLVSQAGKPNTYALFFYNETSALRQSALVGFSAGDGRRNFTHPTPVSSLRYQTNVDKHGAFLYRIDRTNIIEPGDCYLLDDPANGRVEYDSTSVGSIATYICNNGCPPANGTTRECTENGWSGREPNCAPALKYFPYGDTDALECLDPGEVTEGGIAGNYTFYEQRYHQLFVCENGLLSFEKQYCGEPAEKTSTTPPIIAGFWSVINNQGGCHISYGEITNSSPISNLQRSKPQVEHLLHKGFNDTFDPTHIFVATWYHVNGNDTQDNTATFQLVLVSGTGKQNTYAIFLYHDTAAWKQFTRVQFSSGTRNFTNPTPIPSLQCETNVDTYGAFVYRIDGTNVTEPGDCGPLSDPLDGNLKVEYNSTALGSTAKYTCNMGCLTVGDSVRVCRTNGWSGIEPECSAAITCNSLCNPTNGTIQYSGNCRGLVAKYTCNDGYYLLGNHERECQCNGEWTGSVATCEAEISMKFVNNTPFVSEQFVMANFTTNRHNIDKFICKLKYRGQWHSPINLGFEETVTCNTSEDGSSGYFMSNLKPHQFKYTLVVTAITYEEEEATLVGQFRVFSRNTDETNNTCSIHMVNTRSNTGNNAIISKSGCDNKVEFVTIGHPDFKKNVECSTNEFNETIPCKDYDEREVTLPEGKKMVKVHSINVGNLDIGLNKLRIAPIRELPCIYYHGNMTYTFEVTD